MSILMNSVGHLFDPLKLKESDLFDLDIVLSKSLSKIPRFCGILNEFYSVAQHCLSMVDYMEAKGYSDEWVKIALSHEFYEGFASGAFLTIIIVTYWYSLDRVICQVCHDRAEYKLRELLEDRKA